MPWTPRTFEPEAGWQPSTFAALPETTAAPAQPEPTGGPTGFAQALHTGAEAAPFVGQMAGGLLGGGGLTGPTLRAVGLPNVNPLSVGLAGLGGAGGEAYRQVLNRIAGAGGPETGMEAARRIGRAGLIGASTELGGGMIARGAGKLAEPLAPSVRKFLSARTEQVVRNADQRGIVINASEAAKSLNRFRKTLGAAGQKQLQSLEDFSENFLGNKARMGFPIGATQPAGTIRHMTASEAHEAKEYYDSVARAVREARKPVSMAWRHMQGQYVGPAEKEIGQMAEALSNQLRGMLRDQVPGYSAALKAEARNIRAMKAGRAVVGLGGLAAAAGAERHLPVLKDAPFYVRWPIAAAAGGLLASPMAMNPLTEFLISQMGQRAVAGTAANVARAAIPNRQP